MGNELNNICNKEGCTFSQTEKCVLNNDPVTCPDRLSSLDANKPIEESVAESVLPTPPTARYLKSSHTLSNDSLRELQSSKYCKMIGILGIPGSGKTASLVSLYLLLAKNKLKGYEFLDSKSIMAFEEICIGSRRWNESNLPDQLTVHTELSDARSAGFLHLRLSRLENKAAIDLIFPDLPGEWTTDLIETNRNDRFDFLKSCDRIWIMINGVNLDDNKERQYTIHRIELLIDRLKTFLGTQVPDITLIVTHTDTVPSSGNHLNFLKTDGHEGISIKVIEIASFSSNNDTEPGTGIAELIEDTVTGREKSKVEFWPSASLKSNDRNYLKFSINKESQ